MTKDKLDYVCVQRKSYNIAIYNFQPYFIYIKSEIIPIQTCRGPCGSRTLRLSRFSDNWHMKVARISAPCTVCLYPPRRYSWYSFLLEAKLIPGPQCGQD
jgi:hypothetical protein